MKQVRIKTIEAMLREGETVVHPILGESMLPMLDRHTDAVKLTRPNREIEIGDVVMYLSAPNQYTLHRVCGIEKDTLIIRGDNCVSKERVSKKNIIALMDGYIKNNKYIPKDDIDYRDYVSKVLAAGKPLIPEEWNYTVLLYRAAITEGEIPQTPKGIDWTKLKSLCDRQQISAAIAYLIPKLSPAPPEEICRSFSEAYHLTLRRTLLYNAERDRILYALEREHIRYVPMKAITIGALYPKPGMREFADNDILYDKARQNDLVHIMTSLGYEVKSLLGVHDVFYKEPIYNFEMHKALFADASPYAEFFSDIFDRTIIDSSGSRMSDEDFYLHFLAHFAKHHEHSGSGLRPLGDLYLLQTHNHANLSFNRHYVEVSLEKLGLVEFEREMLLLCNQMFENGAIAEEYLRYIMSGSVYGSIKNMISNGIRKKGRLGYLLSRAFLPYRHMKTLFPILRPLPILLPICWGIRIVRAILQKDVRKRAETELNILAHRNPELPKDVRNSNC